MGMGGGPMGGGGEQELIARINDMEREASQTDNLLEVFVRE